MNIETLIELAKSYDEKEWPFSSSEIWRKIIIKKPSAFNLLSYADQLRLSGKSKKAKKIIKKIHIEDVPARKRYLVYSLLGTVYKNQGKINSAIKAYKKSIKLDPNNTFPYIFLATLYSRKGKLKKCKKILNLALNKEGDIDEVYYNLSTTYARQKNYKKAIKTMKKCLKIDPNYSVNANYFLKDWANIITAERKVKS